MDDKVLSFVRMAHRTREDIFKACWRGDKDLVVRIISAGTNPRQVRNPGHWGETLLHTACRYVMHVNSPHLQHTKQYCASSVAVIYIV